MSENNDLYRPALKNSLVAVAWFTGKAESAGVRLPPRKLQFLLYMAQGLYAAANDGRPLMPSRFVAGSLGPADPNLYAALEHAEDLILPEEIDRRAEACLSLIYKKFGDQPVDQIEAFVAADGVFEAVRAQLPDAEIPLDRMGPAYRRAFMGEGQSQDVAPGSRKQPRAPKPAPADRQDELPEGVPKVLTGGKTIRRWVPGKGNS